MKRGGKSSQGCAENAEDGEDNNELALVTVSTDTVAAESERRTSVYGAKTSIARAPWRTLPKHADGQQQHAPHVREAHGRGHGHGHGGQRHSLRLLAESKEVSALVYVQSYAGSVQYPVVGAGWAAGHAGVVMLKGGVGIQDGL